MNRMWDANRQIRLQDDSRAITTIIGAMFVFSFIVILLSVNQAQVVPQQNSEVEFQHFQDVRSDMVKVRTAILSASRTDTVQYTTVSLGTTYPSRVIAMNPPPPTGTLRTTEKHNIIIQGETRKEIGTRFIEYRPGYNELNVGPIRYENSVLYLDQREGSGGVAIIEEQNIVTNNSNEARIPVLKKEYSESSVGRVAIKIQPVGEETKTIGVVPDDQGNVSISIPTRLSGDYWNRSDVPVDGFVSSPDGINRVNITRSIDSVEFNAVGADSAPDGIDIEAEIKGVRPVENATGGPLAYRDRDNDLQYDDGETTYTKDELNNFDRNVNLVIPPDVGTISDGGVSIEADNITSRADYRTDSEGVEFSTGNSDGVIDLATSTIGSSSEKTEIAGSSNAILIRTDIASPGATIEADNVSTTNATISTNSSGVTLSDIDGSADLTNATIGSSSTTAKITQAASSAANVTLNKTSIASPALDVTASNISAVDADISTNSSGVTLSDIDGSADLTNATIGSSSEKTKITQASPSAAEVILNTTTVASPALDVTASNVSATNATISTNSSGVTLSDIDGLANLTDATIGSSSEKTKITQASPSAAEVILNTTTVASPGLDVTASNVSATSATISTNSSGVTLSDIDGLANLTDATISSSSEKTKITQASSSNTKVVAQNADVSSPGLDIIAGKISAKSIAVSTNSSGIDLTSESGPAKLSKSNLSTTSSSIIIDSEDKITAKGINTDSSGKIQLCAEEDINIADGGQESKIKTQGTADADLSSGNDIFTVEGVEITTNNDNKMTYSPSGVAVNNNGDGTNSTESGKVVQTNSGQSSLC